MSCVHISYFRFSNGPEWWRIRKIFQKDLNKIQNVRLYLGNSDMVVKDFVKSRVSNDVDDLLPELSRLFLECEYCTR